MPPRRKISKGAWLWPTISLLMLAGMAAEASTRINRADSAPFQKRCRDAILAIPLAIYTPGGMWTGSDIPVPDSAVQLLQPNCILSRKYIKPGTSGGNVSLLIVDCNDARDLEGHYPLRCYPAQGDVLIDSSERTWHLPDVALDGMEYHFALADNQIGSEIIVYNFFITPSVPGKLVNHPELNGAICKDIQGVYTSGEDYQRRAFGASEFQMIFDAHIPRDIRDAQFVELLTSMQPIIQTLRNLDSTITDSASAAPVSAAGGK